jgi:hypothetical protein
LRPGCVFRKLAGCERQGRAHARHFAAGWQIQDSKGYLQHAAVPSETCNRLRRGADHYSIRESGKLLLRWLRITDSAASCDAEPRLPRAASERIITSTATRNHMSQEFITSEGIRVVVESIMEPVSRRQRLSLHYRVAALLEPPTRPHISQTRCSQMTRVNETPYRPHWSAWHRLQPNSCRP